MPDQSFFYWVLNSFYCRLCAYRSLETKHKINVLWTCYDIGRCGWVGVEAHNVEMGVLLSVWEEAGPAGIPLNQRCGPEPWLQLCRSKWTSSTRQHIFGHLYGLGKTNDGCSLQDFLHVDLGPDSRYITWPSLEILHPSLENARSGYWLCILGILV